MTRDTDLKCIGTGNFIAIERILPQFHHQALQYNVIADSDELIVLETTVSELKDCFGLRNEAILQYLNSQAALAPDLPRDRSSDIKVSDMTHNISCVCAHYAMALFVFIGCWDII